MSKKEEKEEQIEKTEAIWTTQNACINCVINGNSYLFICPLNDSLENVLKSLEFIGKTVKEKIEKEKESED